MRYTVDNQARLRKFIETIRDKPIPEEPSINWLKSNNFKDRRDQQFLEILELLDFVDADNKPNQNWATFHDKSKSTMLMNKTIKEKYSFIFDKYPDATNQSDANLEKLFMDRKYSKDQASQAVKTFKTLLQFAGWM
jgi:hypothetical protein